jgi:hypothetical protein
MSLKRDAPKRGGFERLLFFQLRWFRQSSVKGAPLSFTLDSAQPPVALICHYRCKPVGNSGHKLKTYTLQILKKYVIIQNIDALTHNKLMRTQAHMLRSQV